MNISILKPTDQPAGVRRLLSDLRTGLTSQDFTQLHILVAFAKIGPLVRLESEIKAWRTAGKSINAIIGVDHRGTSAEALSFALSYFNSARIAHGGNSSSPFNPTFHPKIYLFTGPARAFCCLGSNNLTVGGTETNFEAAIIFDLALPADTELLQGLFGSWADAERVSLLLTQDLLDDLVSTRKVLTEAQQANQRRNASQAAADGAQAQSGGIEFPKIPMKPPSALPRGALGRGVIRAQVIGSARRAPVGPSGVAIESDDIAEALVIQVVPHHNGEVFLSTNAIRQNPRFFGFPFTGRTTPKKAGNPPYPQRDPDPIVDIDIYNASGSRTLRVSGYHLNTVFYSPKSEIRITVSPSIVAATPPYAILVMKKGEENSGMDYNIEIFSPGRSNTLIIWRYAIKPCRPAVKAKRENLAGSSASRTTEFRWPLSRFCYVIVPLVSQ